MKATTTTPSILPAAVLGLPIQSVRENSKGVMLCPVTPQPSCRLVYRDHGERTPTDVVGRG